MTSPRHVHPRLLDGLDTAQRDAVAAADAAVLCVAGPGAGKTRVLTHRVAALLDDGVPAHRILAVTFTNKAADELRDRLRDLVGDDADRVWAQTFHSACARILRRDHTAAGLPARFTIADETTTLALLRELHAGEDTPPETRELRELASRVSTAKNQLRRAADLAASDDADDRDLARVMDGYQRLLARDGAVDFDDLLLATLDLLDGDTSAAARWRRRFDHVLVDEFQDTNLCQYRIAAALASHGHLFAVGDQAQSIYSWRGAAPDVADRLRADHPHGRTIALATNYRSTPAIVAASDAVLSPAAPAGRGPGTTPNPDGDPVTVRACGDESDEAASVVGDVAARVAAGDDPADCAVLVRTGAQTRPLEAELAARGVAYDVVGALRFLDRAEVRDALAWVRALVNPRDRAALARAAAAPKRGVGPATWQEAVDAADAADLPVVDAFRLGWVSGRGRAAALRLATAYDQCASALPAGPAAVLRAVYDIGGLRGHVRADQERGVEREENLDALLADAAEFELRGRVADPDDDTAAATAASRLDGADRTRAWLEQLALASSGDGHADDPRGRVQLSTMHAAKGREYAHVWVAGCEDGLVPHALARGDRDRDEERRLLYVAMTRAQTTLTLTWASTRRLHGHLDESRRPSPYLDDLPDGVAHQRTAHADATRLTPGPGDDAGLPAAPRHRRGGARDTRRRGPRRATLPEEHAVAGARVRHPDFGDGTVAGVAGDQLDVAFNDGRQVTLLRSIAPLQPHPEG